MILLNSVLFIASENGHKDVVEILIANNANVNIKGKIGYTALFLGFYFPYNFILHLKFNYLAAENGFKEVVEILINNKADVNHHKGPNSKVLNTPLMEGKKIIKFLAIN